MSVWTVSQRFSQLQWRRLFKELWSRPTTTADSRSPLWQIPHTSNVRLLEDKIQDWVMYLFTIRYGSYAMDQRSGDGWLSGWIKIFIINKKNSNASLKYSMRRLLQNWTKSSTIPASRKRSVWRKWKPKGGPFPSRKTDRLLDLGVLSGHWSQRFCRELYRPIYYWSSKWQYSGIRFKMGRNFIVDDENSTWWHLGRIVKIKNTRVWETQDRVGIVRPGDSSGENRTWLSQIENYGEEKYRARFTK